MKDVLVDFYLNVLKVQIYEYYLVGLKVSNSNHYEIFEETDLARRGLGTVLVRLLKAALPTSVRHRRLFRTKYAEEVDIDSVEICIISIANKVINYTTVPSLADYDLVSTQPIATEFLDKLSQLESILIGAFDEALIKYKQDLIDIETLDQSEVNKDFAVTEEPKLTTIHPNDIEQHFKKSEKQQPNRQPLIEKLVSPKAENLTSKKSTNVLNLGSIPLSELNICNDQGQFVVDVAPLDYLSIPSEFYQNLLELDNLGAKLEFEFVKSLSKRVRTLSDAEDLQIMTVLFSETVMWALAVGLLTVDQLADRDPSVLLALPRLAIFVGCRLLPDSPIGIKTLTTGQRILFMFASYISELAYLNRQLYALRPDQLCRLARWLGPKGLPNLIYSGQQKPADPDSKQSSVRTTLWLLETRIQNNRKSNDNNSQSSVSGLGASGCDGHWVLQEQDNKIKGLSNIISPSQPPNRLVWKTYLSGLHRLFKSISSVTNRISQEYPTELRFALQKVIEMHDTSTEDEALAKQESLLLIQSSPSPPPSTSNPPNIESNLSHNQSDSDDEFEIEREFDLTCFDSNWTNPSTTNDKTEVGNLAHLFNWTEIVHQYEKQRHLIHQGRRHDTTHARSTYHLGSNEYCPHRDPPSGPNHEANIKSKKNPILSNLNELFKNSKFYGHSKSTDDTKQEHDHCEAICQQMTNKWKQISELPTTCSNVSLHSELDFEMGQDIAGCKVDCNDDDDDDDNDPIPMATKGVDKVKSKGFAWKSIFAPITNHKSLNLGISLKGCQSQNDELIHYLPAWQPDNADLSSSPYTSFVNYGDYSTGDNPDEFSSLFDIDESKFSFITGYQCARCFHQFTLIRRRHHCRRCGHIFCASCSNHWQAVEGLATNKPVRVCTDCYEFLIPEMVSSNN